MPHFLVICSSSSRAEKGQEPTGSMGNDSPLAVLSKKPQLLFNYFKQLFAQVTNPPIDPIREDMVMSLESFVGPEKNLLSESPSHCKKLRIKHPVLSIDEFRAIRDIDTNGFRPHGCYIFNLWLYK